MTLNGRGLDDVDCVHLVAGAYELPNEPSGFIIVERISRLDEELLASQEGLCSV
jgi:hypothetical protein